MAETATEARGRGRRRWYVPVGVAAAAAALVVLWPRTADHVDVVSPLREHADTGTVPVPIAPRAVVARVERLVWTSVPRAQRYRVRLYDAEGEVRWTAQTTDTSVALPDSLVLSPGATYFWKVEAQTEWQRWAGSALVEFRLAEGGQ